MTVVGAIATVVAPSIAALFTLRVLGLRRGWPTTLLAAAVGTI
jgi:hypothetical protein